jgi:hypothetical protein
LNILENDTMNDTLNVPPSGPTKPPRRLLTVELHPLHCKLLAREGGRIKGRVVRDCIEQALGPKHPELMQEFRRTDGVDSARA